jgi:hypothetical protein
MKRPKAQIHLLMILPSESSFSLFKEYDWDSEVCVSIHLKRVFRFERKACGERRDIKWDKMTESRNRMC